LITQAGLMMKIATAISKRISPTLFRIMDIDIFGYSQWLEEAEKWTNLERNEWRLRRLGDLLEHCWDHVPFYRELWSDHGVKIRRPGNFDELEAFPIVDRDTFREHRDRIIADNLKMIPHKNDATGGTTGSPLKYKHDLALHALRYGFGLICWHFMGYNYGDDVCTIAGGSLLPGKSSMRNRIRTWLERGHGVSCVGMNQHIAEACYDMIQRYQPVIIQGYPSMISEFCDIIKKENFSFGNLKAVVTTAEMLYPHYRRRIEETLCVPVFDHYGCNDGGVVSFECELHKGFHYNDLESVIEVISPDASGIGPIAITNLWNRSMPFIRYENGDQIALAQDQCTCGRVYPLISSVYGRTGDLLKFDNGRSLGGIPYRRLAGRSNWS
jgi:phenylacetate-CoA ligase